VLPGARGCFSFQWSTVDMTTLQKQTVYRVQVHNFTLDTWSEVYSFRNDTDEREALQAAVDAVDKCRSENALFEYRVIEETTTVLNV